MSFGFIDPRYEPKVPASTVVVTMSALGRKRTLAAGNRSLMQIGRGGQVLNDMAKRFIDRDLAVILTGADSAGEDVADLADHMRVVDDPRIARGRQLGTLRDHSRPVIGDVAGF